MEKVESFRDNGGESEIFAACKLRGKRMFEERTDDGDSFSRVLIWTGDEPTIWGVFRVVNRVDLFNTKPRQPVTVVWPNLFM